MMQGAGDWCQVQETGAMHRGLVPDAGDWWHPPSGTASAPVPGIMRTSCGIKNHNLGQGEEKCF